jgi:hypothetical protein
MRLLAGLLVLSAASAPGLSAQEYLDRGTFVLMRSGAEAGRVEYAVRATSGQQGRGGLLVVGTTRTPAHEVQYILEVSADLAPVSYQLTENGGGRVTRRLSAQIVGPRFSARATTESGEVSRELPVRAPFVILGADDYTVYFFVPRPEPGATQAINVVRTETLTPTTGTVTGEGDDSVSVAGHTLPCRRFAMRLADGELRQFWMTSAGSLLQVAIPGLGIVATRGQAPAR